MITVLVHFFYTYSLCFKYLFCHSFDLGAPNKISIQFLSINIEGLMKVYLEDSKPTAPA